MTHDRLCGALGCTNDATHRLRTDDHGVRVLCETHARDIGGTVVEQYE
jgi:hypothetical protein